MVRFCVREKWGAVEENSGLMGGVKHPVMGVLRQQMQSRDRSRCYQQLIYAVYFRMADGRVEIEVDGHCRMKAMLGEEDKTHAVLVVDGHFEL
jgi:hypothetical protein